jgi:hypothetical protein
MRLSCVTGLLLLVIVLISASVTVAVRLDVAIFGEDECFTGYYTYPESIVSDTCLLSSTWGYYYAIIQQPNNTAK